MEKTNVFERMSEQDYHNDPCPTPSLSSGLIKTLLSQSPLHAWHKHPKLNPNHQEEKKEIFDIGKAAHAIILGQEQKFAVVEAEDWRTKLAQENRKAAYESGMIPILRRQLDEVKVMIDVAWRELESHECKQAFKTGRHELTLAWQEDNGIWCRCRIDNESVDGYFDYKTTDQSANPDDANRMMFANGYDITSAFYKRGIRKCLGVDDPAYYFVVQEKFAPHELAVIAMNPAAEGMAERKVEEAIRLWGECLNSGKWPGYPKKVAYVGAPVYIEQQWLDRENRDQLQKEVA